MAATIEKAITMPLQEQTRRMRSLRQRVRKRTVYTWASDFTHALDARERVLRQLRCRHLLKPSPLFLITTLDFTPLTPFDRERTRHTHIMEDDLDQALEAIARVPILLVATDYDGTLSPIVDNPDDAKPVRESIIALRALATLSGTHCRYIWSFTL